MRISEWSSDVCYSDLKTDCDIPEITHDLADLAPKPLDREALIELYDTYGFRTWLRELSGESDRIPAQDSRKAVETPAPVLALQYETILDTNPLHRWLAQIQATILVALATPTTSLAPLDARLVAKSSSTRPGG